MNELIAVEPQCGASSVGDFVALATAVGFYRGLFVAKYPSYWMRDAYKAAEECAHDLQKTRLRNALDHIKKTALLPTGLKYDPSKAWWLNTTEHAETAGFERVITGSAHPGCEDIHFIEPQSWSYQSATVIASTVAQMIGILRPLLTASFSLVLVDPYFKLTRKSSASLLRELLRVAFNSRCAEFVAYVRESEWGWNARDSNTMLKKQLNEFIGRGKRIRFLICDDSSPSGAKYMHRRYLFSEKGGIELDVGLQLDFGLGLFGVERTFKYEDKENHERLMKAYVEGLLPFDIKFCVEI